MRLMSFEFTGLSYSEVQRLQEASGNRAHLGNEDDGLRRRRRRRRDEQLGRVRDDRVADLRCSHGRRGGRRAILGDARRVGALVRVRFRGRAGGRGEADELGSIERFARRVAPEVCLGIAELFGDAMRDDRQPDTDDCSRLAHTLTRPSEQGCAPVGAP
jgi:hypothetical protein